MHVDLHEILDYNNMYYSSALFVLGIGMNAVPGGYFPLPAEVAHLMSRIPPPHCFNVSDV